MKKHGLFLGMTHYFICFVAGSFIGWLYEIATGFVVWGEYADRGMLKLPICPIYGFGALLLLLLFRRNRGVVSLFLCGAVLTTLLELVISYLAEDLFHSRLWTYAHWPLNFQGRISLISSAIFGLFSVIVIRLLYPQIGNWVRKRSTLSLILLDGFLAAAILWDVAVSVFPVLFPRG